MESRSSVTIGFSSTFGLGSFTQGTGRQASPSAVADTSGQIVINFC